MSIPELAVLESLNLLQPPIPRGEPQFSIGFAPVTAAEVTVFIRRGFRHAGQAHCHHQGLCGILKYKPTKGQIIAVLTGLRGLGSSVNTRRLQEPLVVDYDCFEGPKQYSLTPAGVSALTR